VVATSWLCFNLCGNVKRTEKQDFPSLQGTSKASRPFAQQQLEYIN
jgi:hypothetical protein